MKKDPIFLLFACFIIIYLVWGTTYLANSWGLHSFPPFILAGLRFSIAGAMMLIIIRLKSPLKVSSKLLKETLLAGLLFFAVGNGMLVWGLQFIESGIASLIIALQPLVILLMLWIFYAKKPKWLSLFGTMLGFVGMYLLVNQATFIQNKDWLKGFAAILFATTAWGYISIRISEKKSKENIFLVAGLQMLFGGVILLLMGLILGDFSRMDWTSISDKSFYSLLFLILFGSIIAFSAFNYLLLKVSPVKIATATYVNPLVALFLGWWLNNEVFSSRSIIAAFVLLFSVFLINTSKQKKKEITPESSE